jgi:hypothetical protein
MRACPADESSVFAQGCQIRAAYSILKPPTSILSPGLMLPVLTPSEMHIILTAVVPMPVLGPAVQKLVNQQTWDPELLMSAAPFAIAAWRAGVEGGVRGQQPHD